MVTRLGRKLLNTLFYLSSIILVGIFVYVDVDVDIDVDIDVDVETDTDYRSN